MLRGDRLKNLREAQGFTHQEFAHVLELSLTQIWRYESGKTDPTGDVLGRMAKILSTSADYLLGLTDDPLLPGITENDLSVKERTIIIALREGRNYEAIKVIVSEN